MYVTRPLSLYKKSPEALHEPPPEGPNSGYLVLQDEESTGTTCFGMCKDTLTTDLPFPQNKRLTIRHQISDHSTYYPLFFIPVINQPLSSNRYYAIKADGKHKGEAYAASTEEDRQISCFCCNYIKDQKPRPLDPIDSYQQFEFSKTTNCGNTIFRVEAVAVEAYPPTLLRQAGWDLWNSEPKHFSLGIAVGLNPALRARLPDFDFPLSQDHSQVQVVGKWYSPFMFISEGTLKEQMKRSMFYEITLEQTWDRIYYSENNNDAKGNIMSFDVFVPTQRVTLNGEEAEQIRNDGAGRMQWFRTMDYKGEETKFGLSSLLVQRMIWEQERAGWTNGKEKQVKVTRVEEYKGIGSWKRFGCYLLVERFVFKRIDGSLAMTYNFNHTHQQVKIKWDEMS